MAERHQSTRATAALERQLAELRRENERQQRRIARLERTAQGDRDRISAVEDAASSVDQLPSAVTAGAVDLSIAPKNEVATLDRLAITQPTPGEWEVEWVGESKDWCGQAKDQVAGSGFPSTVMGISPGNVCANYPIAGFGTPAVVSSGTHAPANITQAAVIAAVVNDELRWTELSIAAYNDTWSAREVVAAIDSNVCTTSTSFAFKQGYVWDLWLERRVLVDAVETVAWSKVRYVNDAMQTKWRYDALHGVAPSWTASLGTVASGSTVTIEARCGVTLVAKGTGTGYEIGLPLTAMSGSLLLL